MIRALLLIALLATLRADTIRVGAVQAKNRTIPFRATADEALAAVDKNLTELEAVVAKAAEQKVQALAFPEDTMGVLNWNAAHEKDLKEVLPKAVKQMLSRMGSAAARHNMYLVVCSENIEADGSF